MPTNMMDTEVSSEMPSTESKSPEEEDCYQIGPTVTSNRMQRTDKLSIPELLALRQEFGISSLSLPPFSRPRNLMTATLSSKIAWNPNRLQNMILTVGPGTPAVLVDLSAEPSSPPAAVAAGGEDGENSSSESSTSSDSPEEAYVDEKLEEEGKEKDVEDADTGSCVDVAAARSPSTEASPGSSTSTTNIKRTLSDRLKTSSEDDEKMERKTSTQLQQDINMDVTSSGSEQGSGHVDDTQEAPTVDGVKEQYDEEMAGYSDVEKEHRGEDNGSGDTGEDAQDALTDRERFYLEDNHAEEHRMQFSSNDDEDTSDNEDPHPRPNRRIWERTGDEDDEDESDEDQIAEYREMAAEWFAMEQASVEDEEQSDSDDEEDSDDDPEARVIIRRRYLRRSPSDRRRNINQPKTMKTSIRHQGCINTATWLDAGWRLSTFQHSTSYNANFCEDDAISCHAIASDDCPTQLVTSGDDREIKFWDVRHAMGSANPLPWGRNTHCPFTNQGENPSDPGYKTRWNDFYCKQKPVEPWKLSGNVVPLASMQTGHLENVFHVTPLWQKPGKVATCGADGYLRLGDVEASNSGDANSSAIIVSPEYGGADMMAGVFRLRPPMCFSHHFLNANVGLLCSEKGLRKFDIRLPPRQQERRPLVGGPVACKACAIWTTVSDSSIEEVDSSYVFVGGSGAEVALCDLRMTGGESTSENARIVCQYQPQYLIGNEEVSVSGLDLSKDKKELLVSYESDQIYTFPIFPSAKSAAGPSLEEIGLGCDDMDDSGTSNAKSSMINGSSLRSGKDIFHSELASYGGHLNRFTFLKNARYAGPNDEYICTGSDSGHAWIYERSSGTVVSLLNADTSTCNGVVPHPTLPFFITYGIDSTAKLWRATGPVDANTDDSPNGRSKAFYDAHYEMSPLTREWHTTEHEIMNIEQELAEADAAREEDDDSDDISDAVKESNTNLLKSSYVILPDQVLSRKELMNSGSLGRSTLFRLGAYGHSRIGNDLHSLPEVLRRNQYECLRGAVGGRVGRRGDMPVESDMENLMRRISLIRLRHQADRLGIARSFSPTLPWVLEATTSTDFAGIEGDDEREKVHPADLVPDYPSDWIPYDPEMSPESRQGGTAFDTENYGDFYRERYLHSDSGDGENTDAGDRALAGVDWRELDEDDPSRFRASENAYRILHETARVLKDGGNEALRKGQLDIAAKRYDKAIRYCSVAFMATIAGMPYGAKYQDEFMSMCSKLRELDIEDTVAPLSLKWSPLLKVLISTRLNLSMLLLKQAKHQREVPQLEQAMDQAKHALWELHPFCSQKGKICVSYGKRGGVNRLCPPNVSRPGCTVGGTSKGNTSAAKKTKIGVLRSNEPKDTYKESKTLQAKAFFRLGSAQSDRGRYSEAVVSFEKSIECALELNPDAKLDAFVVRRLAEAKREIVKKNKRQRKKFRTMFSQNDGAVSTAAAVGEKKTSTNSTGPIAAQRKDTPSAIRRRTTPVPIVSPEAPKSASGPLMEDRGTQSE